MYNSWNTTPHIRSIHSLPYPPLLFVSSNLFISYDTKTRLPYRIANTLWSTVKHNSAMPLSNTVLVLVLCECPDGEDGVYPVSLGQSLRIVGCLFIPLAQLQIQAHIQLGRTEGRVRCQLILINTSINRYYTITVNRSESISRVTVPSPACNPWWRPCRWDERSGPCPLQLVVLTK